MPYGPKCRSSNGPSTIKALDTPTPTMRPTRPGWCAVRFMRYMPKEYAAGYSTAKPRNKALLKTTSMVRTEERHRQIARSNPNAKQALGDTTERRTVHTTGYVFDISCKGLTETQILWIASYLKESFESAQVLAIYEYKASHNFHIFVIPPP